MVTITPNETNEQDDDLTTLAETLHQMNEAHEAMESAELEIFQQSRYELDCKDTMEKVEDRIIRDGVQGGNAREREAYLHLALEDVLDWAAANEMLTNAQEKKAKAQIAFRSAERKYKMALAMLPLYTALRVG